MLPELLEMKVICGFFCCHFLLLHLFLASLDSLDVTDPEWHGGGHLFTHKLALERRRIILNVDYRQTNNSVLVILSIKTIELQIILGSYI